MQQIPRFDAPGSRFRVDEPDSSGKRPYSSRHSLAKDKGKGKSKYSTAIATLYSSGASEGRIMASEEIARRRINQQNQQPSQNFNIEVRKMRHGSDVRTEIRQPDLARLDAELRRRSLRRVPRSDERLAASRDRESLGALVGFLKDVSPPPTNRMSVPDPTSSTSGRSSESSFRRMNSTKRRTGIKRAFGLLLRRGSTKKQQKPSPAKGRKTASSAPARQPSTRRKKKRPPRIKLPDSAVAGRTVEGYRHIAISIPIEHAHLSPEPRYHPQVRKQRSRSLSTPYTSSGHLVAPIVRPGTAIGPSSHRTSHLGLLVEERDHLASTSRAKGTNHGHSKGELATARKVRLTSRHTFGTPHEGLRRSTVVSEVASLSVPPRTSEERRSAAHQEALEALISSAPAPSPGSPNWRVSPGLARPVSAYSFRSFTSEAASPPPVPVSVPLAPTVRTHRRHNSGSSGKWRRHTNESIDSSLDHTFRESIFSDLSCIESINTNGSSDYPTAMVREAQPARRFEGADIVECASPRSSSEARRRSRSRGSRARSSVRENSSIAGRISQASNNPRVRPQPIEVPPRSAARNNSMRVAIRPQSMPRQPQQSPGEESSSLLPGEHSRSEVGRLGARTPLVHEGDARNGPYFSAQSQVEKKGDVEGLPPDPELANANTNAETDDEFHYMRFTNLQFPPVPPERISSRNAVQKVPAAAPDPDLNEKSEAPFPQRSQQMQYAMIGNSSSEWQAGGSKSTALSRKQRFEQLRRALERPDAQPSDLLWERRSSVSSNGSADSAMAPTERDPNREDVLFLDPSTPATPLEFRPETSQPTLKLTGILTVADFEPSSPYSTSQPRLPSVPVSVSTDKTSATVIRTSQPSPQDEDQPATPPGSPAYSASTTSRFSTADADKSPVYLGPLVPPKRAKPTLFRRYSSASYTQGIREFSLPRPKTAGKRSAASEKNFFTGATMPERFLVAGGGRNTEDVFAAEEADIQEKPTLKLTRSQIFERYEALREKQTQDLERRLRRLEHTEDHWLASMLPLLMDLNKVIARLHLPNDEEEDRIEELGGGGGASGNDSGRPPYDAGPRGFARRPLWGTRSGAIEGPPRSSHAFHDHTDRHDWNTEDMYRGIPERHRPFHFEQEHPALMKPHTHRHHSKTPNAIRPARWSTPNVPPNPDYVLGPPSSSTLAFRDRDFAASTSAINRNARSRSSLPASKAQSMRGPRLFHDIERMAQRDGSQNRVSSSLKDILPSSFAFAGAGAASAPPGDIIPPTETLLENGLEMTLPSRLSFDSISSLATYDDTASGSCDDVPVPRQRRYHHHHSQGEDDEAEREAEGEENLVHQLGPRSFHYQYNHHPTAPYRTGSGSTGMENIEPLMRELQATGSRLSGESYEYEAMGDDEVRKMRQRPGPRAVVEFRAFK